MGREEAERVLMVEKQIESRGVGDKRVLNALKKVPRHSFVPKGYRDIAYTDQALPAYCGQTISQPYIVGAMTELLRLQKSHRVLEIGTGTGYQTAVLAELAGEVYSMEIIPQLHAIAKENLAGQDYKNINLIIGDGYKGYPEAAPYDAIIVTAAPPYIPEALIKQLAPGGKMAIPVGASTQELYLIEKDYSGKIGKKEIFSVVFVPMRKEGEESGW